MSVYKTKKNLEKNSYYIMLVLASLIGVLVLIHRCRLGVDLNDETWYVSDPYWVAKGITPYVNNWSQAPGFTLPLYLAFSAFLKVTGGTEGIILFSRILFCIWKMIVVLVSFCLLKKADIEIPSILSIPLIVFVPHQLFDINYNTVGLSYVFLIFSLLSTQFNLEDRTTRRGSICIGIMAGILMGRCVIGTPHTVIACLVIILLLISFRKWHSLIGFFIGGIIAIIMVVSFCCIREGLNNFIVGIQYMIKDLNYSDLMAQNREPILKSTQYLVAYLRPFFIVMGICIVLKVLMHNHIKGFDYILKMLLMLLLVVILIYLTKYDGQSYSIALFTKFGWFIPIVCRMLDNNIQNLNRIRFCSFVCLTNICIYICQGYTVLYGFRSRSYWNYLSMILGMYCIYICFKVQKRDILLMRHAEKIIGLIVGVVITIITISAAYKYVFDDLECNKLTYRIESGIWSGCYSTEQRAGVVVMLEQELKNRTDSSDKLMFWGRWSCFLNLLCNGKMLNPYPLGVGQKNGFDLWHMYQLVPNKAYIHIMNGDRTMLTNTNEVWKFVSLFYEETEKIDYISYNSSGEEQINSIIEFSLINKNEALNYADKMATNVFIPTKQEAGDKSTYY